MKVLVTGSTGMLGQAIVSTARERDHDVVGLARHDAERIADLADDAAIAKVFKEIAPDVIVNCAAVISLDACEQHPTQAWRLNVRAVQVLGELSAACGAKLVHISTDHYFTGDGQARHDEAATVAILNEYARTKFASEEIALRRKDALVLRTNLVGFRGWSGRPVFVEWIIDTLRAGLPMTMFDDAYVSSIDAQNFAASLLDLIDRDSSGLLNLASRDVFSKKSFIEALAGRLRLSLESASVGSVHSLETKRGESLGLDVSAAENILGYSLPGLDGVIDSLANEYAERREAACHMTV